MIVRSRPSILLYLSIYRFTRASYELSFIFIFLFLFGGLIIFRSDEKSWGRITVNLKKRRPGWNYHTIDCRFGPEENKNDILSMIPDILFAVQLCPNWQKMHVRWELTPSDKPTWLDESTSLFSSSLFYTYFDSLSSKRNDFQEVGKSAEARALVDSND